MCPVSLLTPTDSSAQLACLLAAIVHDMGHPGHTNDYLVASWDPLALTYNDAVCSCFVWTSACILLDACLR